MSSTNVDTTVIKTDVKSKNRDLKKNKVEEEILPYEWILRMPLFDPDFRKKK